MTVQLGGGRRKKRQGLRLLHPSPPPLPPPSPIPPPIPPPPPPPPPLFSFFRVGHTKSGGYRPPLSPPLQPPTFVWIERRVGLISSSFLLPPLRPQKAATSSSQAYFNGGRFAVRYRYSYKVLKLCNARQKMAIMSGITHARPVNPGGFEISRLTEAINKPIQPTTIL